MLPSSCTDLPSPYLNSVVPDLTCTSSPYSAPFGPPTIEHLQGTAERVDDVAGLVGDGETVSQLVAGRGRSLPRRVEPREHPASRRLRPERLGGLGLHGARSRQPVRRQHVVRGSRRHLPARRILPSDPPHRRGDPQRVRPEPEQTTGTRGTTRRSRPTAAAIRRSTAPPTALSLTVRATRIATVRRRAPTTGPSRPITTMSTTSTRTWRSASTRSARRRRTGLPPSQRLARRPLV